MSKEIVNKNKSRNLWKIGDIVKVGNIRNVKVIQIGVDKNLRNSYTLESITNDKKYRYSFGRGVERIL